jgi:Ras association domain-containing protein 9/10
LEHRISNVDDSVKVDNDYELSSAESDDETIELWSSEIPVWIKGEQRWISGVTDQTTCLDLIEALLMDEGVIKPTSDSNNNHGTNLYPTKVNDYIIAERWRRVEQVLDPRTKILKIWTAWGAEQAEVRKHIQHA